MIAKPPAGALMPFAGAAAPAGYLACDGSAVSRTTYAALYAAIGTTYGAGDGSTTFNLPDLERRAIVGAGGSATSTLANTVGATGGEESHALTVAEMPSHNHAGATFAAGGHSHGAGTYVAANAGSHRHTIPHRLDNPPPHTPAQNRTLSQEGHGTGTTLTGSAGSHGHTITGRSASAASHAHTISASGGGGRHNNMQPSIVMLWIISTG